MKSDSDHAFPFSGGFNGRITLRRAGGSYVIEITDEEVIQAVGMSCLPVGYTGAPLEVLRRVQQSHPRAEVVLSEALKAADDPFPTRSEGGYLHRWTKWLVETLDAGAPVEVARLGSEVMRRAYEEDWPEDLRRECGWGAGRFEAMQRLAVEQPDRARRRWQSLLSGR